MTQAHGKRGTGCTFQDSWQTDKIIAGNESQLTGSICLSGYVKEFVSAGTWMDRRPGGVSSLTLNFAYCTIMYNVVEYVRILRKILVQIHLTSN